MSQVTARLSRERQLSIPSEVCPKMGAEPGDEVEFVEEGGSFLFRKHLSHPPFDPFIGFLKDMQGQDPDEIAKDLRGHDCFPLSMPTSCWISECR
ncbi:MAG: AbrB/MazE/SpoVT family DNA-binding domain-containing protein [Acidobacteriota bacterium]